MDNSIIDLTALRASREMLAPVVKDERAALLNKLRELVEDNMAAPNGAHICRLDLHFGVCDELEVSFELGFKDASGKIDFGSDCWFQFGRNGLGINYGTIGSWTKENVFQVKRIKMISNICDQLANPDAEQNLEEKFRKVLRESQYLKKQNELWEVESQIKEQEAQQKKDEADQTLASVKVGSILCYSETTYPASRLFLSRHGARTDDHWQVTRIGEKTITLESLYNSNTRRVSKKDILQHIIHWGLNVINE